MGLGMQPSPLAAQEAGGQLGEAAGGLEAPEFLTAVPENPAFVFLGVTPTSITRPGATRDFGVAVLNGINADGKLQQGFALETSPWFYIPGLKVRLSDYQSKWHLRVLTNTQFSLGTARVSGDTASTDLGFGVRLTLLDQTDPMANVAFTDSLDQILKACEPGQLPCPPDPEDPEDMERFARELSQIEAAAQKCIDKGMRQAYKAFSERTRSQWNAARVAFAFATGWRFEGSDLGEGTHAGLQTWLVGAAPVSDFGQLIGQLAFTHRPELGETSEFDRFNYGARFLTGSATFNSFLELVGESRSGTNDDTNDSSGLWSAGVEFRVAENLWISTGLGSRFGTLDEAESAFVIADVRWGLSSKSRLEDLRRENQ